jgi:two-component system LytT family response regulator
MADRRIVIADDEPLARERLRHLLGKRTGYTIVAECENGEEAIESILRDQPDILLLDIKMPAMDGFEVAEALGVHSPALVFVTAFAEFALRAFDVSAIDYLLKPVSPQQLDRALARAEAQLSRGRPDNDHARILAFLAAHRNGVRYPSRFLVRSAEELFFVRAEDIDWADAQGNYVRLHVAGRAHMIRETLKSFEARLNPEHFVRIHRSAIVNIDRIVRIKPYQHGEFVVTLRDGARLTTSRSHGARLRELLR